MSITKVSPEMFRLIREAKRLAKTELNIDLKLSDGSMLEDLKAIAVINSNQRFKELHQQLLTLAA